MEQNEDNTVPVRRRAVPDDVRRGKLAMEMVRPFNIKIGEWQEEVARLVSSGAWQRTHGRLGPDFAEKVAVLRQTVEAGRGEFGRELELLPPEMRQHGRVTDTLNALDTVIEGLERAGRLGEATNGRLDR